MNPEKLSPKVRELLQNPENEILVSSVSLWEVSIKYRLGKIELNFDPKDLPFGCQELGFKTLSLDTTVASTYHLLKSDYHRDPFDRMLIRQAIVLDIPLISKDDTIKLYQSEGLKVLW
jgi:PIN domain nuclease of toxin-antitoxin system